MKRISEAVIRHRKLIMGLTILLCVISLFTMQLVQVNYDLGSYLPEDSSTAKALRLVTSPLPNLQLYLPGLSVSEALKEKAVISSLPGVLSVLWLDDVVDLRGRPFETVDPVVSGAYFNEGPRFHLTLAEERQSEGVLNISALYPNALMKGVAADSASVVNVTMNQVASIMYLVIPLCLLILVLATRHWVDPLFFLLTIGTAILLNEGTNVIFGSVSFITRACSAVLQLAVSIDYAIFFLHRFGQMREEGMEAMVAMKMAMRKSASVIASSAMTTVFGFLALTLMNFNLGRDMGFVLAKGVLLSYLSVIIILPAFAASGVGLIDRTAHRSLLPTFKGFGRVVVRFGTPLAIILLLILPAAFIAQRQNVFIYGSGGMHSPDSPRKMEQREIEDRFGREQMMLLMVPAGDRAREVRLSRGLRTIPEVRGVTSYVDTVSAAIPPDILPPGTAETFYQDGFARLILSVDTEDEGERPFELVRQIREIAATVYPEASHLLGETAVNEDLKRVITGDSLKVMLAGILSIGIILMISFRSISIPLILLLIIQGSIWLNMSLPYYMGSSLNYIGYQIVSSVQLGATVDYGILLTQRYLEGRKTMGKRDAAAWALSVSAGSIIPPALIFCIAGYSLNILVRENGIISEMGMIMGRGAALSLMMVLLVLPIVLVWCDGIISRTTLKGGKEIL